MMNKEDAIKKIKEINSSYNMMTEYEKGFMFWVDTEERTIGGGNAPKVVMKEDGKIISMAQAVMIGLGEEIADVKV